MTQISATYFQMIQPKSYIHMHTQCELNKCGKSYPWVNTGEDFGTFTALFFQLLHRHDTFQNKNLKIRRAQWYCYLRGFPQAEAPTPCTQSCQHVKLRRPCQSRTSRLWPSVMYWAEHSFLSVSGKAGAQLCRQPGLGLRCGDVTRLLRDQG